MLPPPHVLIALQSLCFCASSQTDSYTSGPLHQLFLPLWMFEIFAQTLAKSCIHSFSDENWVTESKVASEPCTGFRHRGCKVHYIKYSCIGYCLVSKLCPTLLWPPWTVAPPGSSVHGISQARVLEWLPFPSPGDIPYPGIEPVSPALQMDSLTLNHQGSPPNTLYSVKFAFQKCRTYFYLKLFILYLKFKFNRMIHILFDNHNP